jgi:phage tail sheath gpL-like
MGHNTKLLSVDVGNENSSKMTVFGCRSKCFAKNQSRESVESLLTTTTIRTLHYVRTVTVHTFEF